MSRRKQPNPRAMKEEGETNEKRMRGSVTREEEEGVGGRDPSPSDGHPPPSHDENLIQCALCDAQFLSIALLQMHTITVHIPQPSPSIPSFVCPQCDLSLPSITSFAVHMKCHLAEKIISCPICGKSMREEEEYLDHLTEHIIVTNLHLSCSDCRDVSFRDEGEFILHSIDKHARLQFMCAICSKVFGDEFSFKIHSMGEHSESRVQYQCTVCEISFDSKGHMQAHLQSVHSTSSLRGETEEKEKELPILHCSLCDIECKGENALDEHRLITHCKITESDSCGVCHLPISTQSQFIAHCERHASDSQMSCVVCRQTVRSAIQLNVHAKFHAFEDVRPSMREEKEEECSPIPSLVPFPPPLTHTTPVSPPRSFRCSICSFRFNSQSRLDTHTRKHATSMSATCQICGDQFAKQDQLSIHMESHKTKLAERAREGLSVHGS